MSLRVPESPTFQRPVLVPAKANLLAFGANSPDAPHAAPTLSADLVTFGAAQPKTTEKKDFWGTVYKRAFGVATPGESFVGKLYRITKGVLMYPIVLAMRSVRWLSGDRSSFDSVAPAPQSLPVPRPDTQPLPLPTFLPNPTPSTLVPAPTSTVDIPAPPFLPAPTQQGSTGTVPSTRFEAFNQALALSGKSLEDTIRGALTADNVLGRGANDGFCAIPGLPEFGLKAPIGFGLGFGGVVADVNERLASILRDLPDKLTVEALPTKVGDLPEASHNVAVVRGPDRSWLFTIQNRLPGKNLINLIDDPMSDQDCQHIQSNLLGMVGNYRIRLEEAHRDLLEKQGKGDTSDLQAKKEQLIGKIKERFDLFNAVASIQRKPISEEAQIDELIATVPARYLKQVANIEVEGDVDETRLKRTQAKRTLKYVATSLATQAHYLAYLQMLAKAPQSSYTSFLKTLETLNERNVGVDTQHSGNVVFDPVSQRFGVVDLNERGTEGAHVPHCFSSLLRVLFVRAKGQSSSYLDYMFDEAMGKQANVAARQILDKLFIAQYAQNKGPLMQTRSVAGMTSAYSLYDYEPPAHAMAS